MVVPSNVFLDSEDCILFLLTEIKEETSSLCEFNVQCNAQWSPSIVDALGTL